MSRKKSGGCCISLALIFFFGILFGFISSALWFFDCIDFVRPMMPYTFVFGLVALTVTAFIGAKCNEKREDVCEKEFNSECDCHPTKNCTCLSIAKYAKLIIISAGVVVVFAMTVITTCLSFIAKYVIGLVGAVGFWILLFSFLSMLLCFFARKRS